VLIKIRGLTKDRVRLALLLPSAQFFAWLVLVPVTALLTYGRLSEMRKAEAGRTHIQTKDFEVTIRPDNRLLFAFGPICERRFHGVVNIDLPGVVVGAPLTIPAVRLLHQNAVPWGIDLWHVLTLPFFSLPVWWWIGRTYDRFRARKPLPAWQAVLASFLGAACVSAGIALMVPSPSEDKSELMPFLPGVVLWSGLFLTIPAVWALQKKILAAGSR
jgi:hypothetical protein